MEVLIQFKLQLETICLIYQPNMLSLKDSDSNRFMSAGKEARAGERGGEGMMTNAEQIGCCLGGYVGVFIIKIIHPTI